MPKGTTTHRIGQLSVGMGFIALGILALFGWFYIVMYQWIWLGLMGAQGLGSSLGLFFVFIVLSFVSIIVGIALLLMIGWGVATIADA